MNNSLIRSFFAIILSAGLIIITSSIAYSQWQMTNGPYNAIVNYLVANTNEVGESNLFAGSQESGVFLSSNNGATWVDINTDLTFPYVYSLVVGPNAGGGTNLFVGTGGAGVFLSTNNGGSWTAANAGIANASVYALAVKGNYLFAGTYYNKGVFRSSDNGTTWTAVNSGLPTSNNNISFLSISPNGNIFAATYNNGVFISTNNGDSWTAVNNGLGTLRIVSLAITPNGTIFAGNDYMGIWRSSNNGTSWTKVVNGLTYSDVRSFAVSSDGNIFAGTYGGGIFLSTNNGTNWNEVNTGFTDSYPQVSALAISPNGNLFAGLGTIVWTRPLSEMIPNRSPIANAGPDQVVEQTNPIGVNIKLDGSASTDLDGDVLTYLWKEGITTLSDSIKPSINLTLGMHVIVLTVDDSKGGTNSDTVYVNIFDTTPPVLLLNGQDTTIIYLGSSYNEEGVTVSDLIDPSPQISISGIVDTSKIGTYTITYTATDFSGNTSSCNRLVQVIKPSTAKPIIVVSRKPMVLWPPYHQYEKVDIKDIVLKVFDSQNKRMSECAVNVYSISCDEPEDLPGNGDGRTRNDIVISKTHHCKHERHYHKEKSVYLRAERQDNGNGRVYTITLVVEDSYGAVGTAEYEVWVPVKKSLNVLNDGISYTVLSKDADKYSLEKTGEETITEIPQINRLFSNYPNPFNPTTEIQFGIVEESFVNLTIYDMLGREVTTLVQDQLRPGTYTATFNATGLSSGIYIYRLQAGSYVETRRMILMK